MTLLWIAVGLIAVAVTAFIFASRRDASFRRAHVLPAAGQARMADVEQLVQAGKRIEAIRVYREIHHVGLTEAKEAIEKLRSDKA